MCLKGSQQPSVLVRVRVHREARASGAQANAVVDEDRSPGNGLHFDSLRLEDLFQDNKDPRGASRHASHAVEVHAKAELVVSDVESMCYDLGIARARQRLGGVELELFGHQVGQKRLDFPEDEGQRHQLRS